VNISASVEEQALWRAQLARNAQPGGRAHGVLRRSAVAAPPPAALPSAAGAAAERAPAEHMACAHCRGAARLTCEACLGVHYCTKECQAAHWPAHKAACRSGTAAEPSSSKPAAAEPAAQPAAAQPAAAQPAAPPATAEPAAAKPAAEPSSSKPAAAQPAAAQQHLLTTTAPPLWSFRSLRAARPSR
jgi:hypothetical protein